MDATHYLAQLQALLPPGRALTREPSAVLTAVLAALAEEFGRVDARALQLLEEADPRTAYDLLPGWERVAGLPDSCAGDIVRTLEDRRGAVWAQLASVGGQSASYLIARAAEIGHTITITEIRPTIAGVMQAGDEVVAQHEHRHYWQVNVPVDNTYAFVAGVSTAGDELGYWQPIRLECLFARLKPAHTDIIYNYLM